MLLKPAPAPAPPSHPGLRARVRAALGERGTPRRLLARNGAWNAAVFLAGAVAAFALRPFVVGSLGDALFGVWSVVASLTGYMGFADLGVRPAVVHYVSKHVSLAAANLAGSALDMGLKSALAFRAEPRLRFAPRLARRDVAMDLLRYGAFAVLVSLSLLLVWQTDSIVIGALLSLPAVTWFS